MKNDALFALHLQDKTMLKKITLKKIFFAILFLLAIFQFFRIDKTNPPADAGKDFLKVTNAPSEIASIIKLSCYDCHSNEVIYPWYTNVAPVSWWIKHHINEGRHHLNFSIWGTYNSRRMDKKLKECIENIKEGEMPMSSYTLIHRQAKLSAVQIDTLSTWFYSMRNFESDKRKENQ